MKTFILSIGIFVTGLTVISCNEKVEQENIQPAGVVVAQDINVRVTSKTGVDLLDPANADGFKQFRIYYAENGEKTLYYQPLLDAAGGYKLLKHGLYGYYYLKVFMNHSKSNLEATTFLQLGNEAGMDTIRTLYRASTGASVIAIKVWMNNKLVWTMADGEPTFEIIKP